MRLIYSVGQLHNCTCNIYIFFSDDEDTSQLAAAANCSQSEWTLTVNRGGLIVVNELIYKLFVGIELEVRRHLSVTNAILGMNMKELIVKKVVVNEDVLLHWDIISINWEATESKELLFIITEQFVTVRGFSFVDGFMELYKQSKKRSTQKTKALRKTLCSTRVCHDN